MSLPIRVSFLGGVGRFEAGLFMAFPSLKAICRVVCADY